MESNAADIPIWMWILAGAAALTLVFGFISLMQTIRMAMRIDLEGINL